jgi:S-formylglutathione hydrolase FrmB
MVLKKGIRKCLSFILSSAMIVGMLTTFNLSVLAEDAASNSADVENYTVDGLDSEGRMVSYFGSPVIDGEVDDVWNDAITVVPQCVTGDVYAEATFKSLWDDNALYILAEVKDSQMSVQSRNPYEQDSLEIFLDENNEKSKDYGVDDLHFRVNYENLQTADNGDAERFFTSTRLIDGGYLVEARVQFKYEPSNGKVLGVELQINDGVGASRVGTVNLFDSTNSAWEDTGKFGEVILLGKTEDAVSGLNPYSLKNLIEKTKKTDFTRYTNASIVMDAIEKAEEVLADENITQKQIDEQYDALKAAIGKLKLTEEAANEKEFIPLSDEYRLDNEKQGTIERLSYNYADVDNGTTVKALNVYLPYGYDPSNKAKKYNVLYLMHGGGENVNTIFGEPGESKELTKILDNMIAKGDIEPLIVVTPSFYGGKNDGNVELFHEELTSEIIPLVETKYNTYLRSTSLQDIKASRDHRAFGGFSMGSMTTWNVFANCLDYVKYYMPLCAGFRFGAQNPDEPSSAEYLANVAINSGYKIPEDFKIFAASGSADVAHPGMEPQMNEMRELTDAFIYSSDTKKGNLYFIVCDGGTHAWGYVNQYIYNILPDLFEYKTVIPVPSSNTSGGSNSSARKDRNKSSTATATPTAILILNSSPVISSRAIGLLDGTAGRNGSPFHITIWR